MIKYRYKVTMAKLSHESIDHGNNPPDYTRKITEFLEQTHPAITLPERTVNLMVAAFEKAYYTYGRGQTDATRRAYHNDEHAFEVFQRAVSWLERFEEHFDVSFETKDYEVVGMAAAYHDIIIGTNDESISDEALSAQAATKAMRSSPVQFGAKMRRRVERAIEATTVEYRDGGVFQTRVVTGEPDFAVVAVALADSSAILTESEEKIIEDISKLALERLPHSSTDITATTDAVMKILSSEERFVIQRLDDLQRYLEFLSKDPDKAKRVFEHYFAGRRQHLLRFAAHIDSRLSEVQQTVGDALVDSIESTERVTAKIHHGIMRGLGWLPQSK